MKIEEERVLSYSKHHDNRIFLLLVLTVVLLAGLYVVNFKQQQTLVKAEFGCSTGQYPIPIQGGVNLCPPAKRTNLIVRNIGGSWITSQCCKSDTVLPTIAAFRNIDNAYCNSQLGVTNAYCSKSGSLTSPKCEGIDSSTDLRCGTAKQRVCCVPRTPISRPIPTSVPVPTSIPVPTLTYNTTCDASVGLYSLMSNQEQALKNKGFCSKNPGYGKYIWNGFYGGKAKCYSQFTKLCSTTQSGYVREGSVRCLNNEVAMTNCIASSPVLLADFNSNVMLSCPSPSGTPKYIKDQSGKCYLEGGRLITSSLNNKKFCVNLQVDSTTPGCQRTPPVVCTGGDYAWGGLNPSTGFDTCYRQKARYDSSAGYCVQKAVPSEYCACKENNSMSVCATLPSSP